MSSTKRPALPNIGWDPTPGDVEDTRDLAKKLGALAGELGSAVRDLERIECGAWKGKAALAFTEYIGEDVTPLIRKSHESFDKASRALYRWAKELKEFQDETDRLEKKAGEKLDARSEAKPDSKESAKASGDVDEVIGQVHDLEDRFAKAAGAISKELDKAGDIAPDEPGFWDKLTKGVADAWDATGKWIKDHADMIKLIGDLLSDLSGVLAMIAIITAPFEPIGAIFATAAVLTSGLALATHLVAKAAGADVSWVAIGFDALGSLPGIGAFTKGVKVADGGVAAARAAKLGEGFKGVSTVGRNIVGVGDNVAGAASFTIKGRKIGLGGLKAGGFISTEGGLMNRMSLVAEKTVRNGQLLGTGGLPGLKNIDSMSNLGRGIDAAIKIAPKTWSIPNHIGEMTSPGDRLQESAAAH
ncbi:MULTISPECIES: enoyl-CoA hydratase/isomerase family protein [unclassified Streptomyces]|uniref:enoyl-CoA hydratase/isomerase family protein n=1 Tax=unclassified Streptomyces TaxID=2593676 RepID=UPI001368D10D|nr:enoyl-CoA hydratase/isomerase family protein [Streptomyces sp. SID335]MYZ18295.1 enoyl-CoA hydratase/isomerase family protein [Streptomyces sp. SID337]NDZ87799.1 enoyl-CoA hydratase/isomerase family protein [Streptomyces sp. SID10115]NEA01796.1 enoyl-CoA hydratase/isomerase family protein [Streptomyces sp. SID10116]NEB48931.1 enoyl-CoA hydratase/isomerase family protein [Streptomyces sp. SID339]